MKSFSLYPAPSLGGQESAHGLSVFSTDFKFSSVRFGPELRAEATLGTSFGDQRRQVVRCRFARFHGAFHESLPLVRQMLAGKGDQFVRALQDRQVTEPLARLVKRVGPADTLVSL